MRVGFTGTRRGLTAHQHRALGRIMAVLDAQVANEDGSPNVEGHHGMCVGGDEQFHAIARLMDWRMVGHPPTDTRFMSRVEVDSKRLAKPYLDRDREIVREVDLLLACPFEMSEIVRSGTWATWRYATAERLPRYLILPNGVIETHDYVDT